MPGYSDPKFRKADAAPTDSRWRGHRLPVDPEPHDGTIRVFVGGRWQSWDRYNATRGMGGDALSTEIKRRPVKPGKFYNRSQNNLFD